MQLKSNKVRIIACLLVLVMTITVVSLNNPFGVFADTEEPTFEVATEDTADFELDFGDSGDSGDFDEPDNSDHGDNANNFDNNDNDSIGGNDNDTNDSNDNNLNNEPEPNEPNDTPAPPETEVSNVPESLPETGATDIPDSPETGANNIPDNIFSPEPDNDLPNINNVAPATPEMPLLPRVPLGTRDAANLTVADITSLNLTSNAAVQFVGDMVLFSTSPVANGFVQGNLEYAVDWQATQNGREILSHSTSGTQSANVVRFVVLETGDLLVTATVQGTGITARATVEVRSNGDDENLGGSSNESSGENSTENSSENLNTPNVTPAATPPHSPVAPIETLPPGTSVANTPIPSDWWWDGNTWRPPVNWSGGDGWWWDGNTWRPPNWSGGDGWWWDGGTWRPPNWNSDWWWDGGTWRPPNWNSD
ncbi:MAG: hypothetical protein FWG68_02295, partial [Defluviitaleaceae bacterium]|nr:hypothetical protein [Defluviitaleaceae bacterium]